jgi:hypothetical protein
MAYGYDRLDVQFMTRYTQSCNRSIIAAVVARGEAVQTHQSHDIGFLFEHLGKLLSVSVLSVQINHQ